MVGEPRKVNRADTTGPEWRDLLSRSPLRDLGNFHSCSDPPLCLNARPDNVRGPGTDESRVARVVQGATGTAIGIAPQQTVAAFPRARGAAPSTRARGAAISARAPAGKLTNSAGADSCATAL